MLTIEIRKRTVFIFLTLIGLLIYSNSFSVPFHYDDILLIKENINLKSYQFFSEWIGDGYLKIITGRAFLLFTFYLNYIVNGLDAFGYHIVNLLVHISTAFLFYLLVAKYVYKDTITRSIDDETISLKDEIPMPSTRNDKSLAAIIAASLFLLHPINTESVTYISSRSSELSAMFILASILCFLRATEGIRKFHLGFYLLSLLFFLLGLSAKEAAIVTPALILLFDIYFVSNGKKKLTSRIKYYLPFWGMILLGFNFYSGYILHSAMRSRLWLTHILTELKVFVEYLKLLILPLNLNIDHDIKASVFFDAPAVFSILIIAGILIAAFFIRNQNKILSFSIVWFFINLAPFLLIKLEDYMAERWVYAASLGFSLFICELLIILSARYKKTGIFAIISIMIFSGTLTYMRNAIYKDPIALWADAARKAPDKPRPYVNLCAYYDERKELDKAVWACKAALDKGSIEADTYVNLATAYFFKNELDNAEMVLTSMTDRKKGVRISREGISVYHYNLGSIYKGRKDYKRAIDEYKKILEISPKSPAALGLIAECYYLLGIEDKAKEYAGFTVNGIPQNGEDYIMLSKSLFYLGENQKAVESLNKAVITEPLNINVRHAVASIFLEGGNPEAAYRHFSVMAKLSPDLAASYTGMGKAMLAKGDLREARKNFQKALSLIPPDSPSRKELLGLLDRT